MTKEKHSKAVDEWLAAHPEEGPRLLAAQAAQDAPVSDFVRGVEAHAARFDARHGDGRTLADVVAALT